jgi:hypothetical protein
MIAMDFAILSVPEESDNLTFRGYTPHCFGEQIANKGLPGKECKRVRNGLKIRELLGRLKNAFGRRGVA